MGGLLLPTENLPYPRGAETAFGTPLVTPKEKERDGERGPHGTRQLRTPMVWGGPPQPFDGAVQKYYYDNVLNSALNPFSTLPYFPWHQYNMMNMGCGG